MQETGRLLKEARQNKNLSLSEVASATKINVKVLQAMEEGDINRLPPKSFTRGFVRTYALYLKMDSQRVLNQFQEEMGSTQPTPEKNFGEQLTEHPENREEPDAMLPDRTLSSKNVLKTTVAIVLVALIVVAINQFNKYKNETVVGELPKNVEPVAENTEDRTGIEVSDAQKVTGSLPTEAIIANAPKNDRPIIKEPEPPKQASNIADDNEAKRPKPAAAPPKPKAEEKVTIAQPPTEEEPVKIKEKVAPPKESANKTAEATNKNRDKNKVEQKAEQPQINAATTDEQSKELVGATRQTQELILEALDSVTIEFAIDGGGKKVIQLKPEQLHTIKAAKNIKMTLSDGGVVNVIYNGLDKGVPGDLGKPIQLNFPK